MGMIIVRHSTATCLLIKLVCRMKSASCSQLSVCLSVVRCQYEINWCRPGGKKEAAMKEKCDFECLVRHIVCKAQTEDPWRAKEPFAFWRDPNGNADDDDDDDDNNNNENVAANSVADCHLSMRFAVAAIAFNCVNGYLSTFRYNNSHVSPSPFPFPSTHLSPTVSAESVLIKFKI